MDKNSQAPFPDFSFDSHVFRDSFELPIWIELEADN